MESGADAGLMGILCYMVRPNGALHVLASVRSYVSNGTTATYRGSDALSGLPFEAEIWFQVPRWAPCD